jgi:hypothetical protein
MATPISKIRNYNMKDSVMCQQSRVKRQHFINNQADFIDFDPDFSLTFQDDWLLSIETAEGIQTDETRDDVLQQETEDVLLAMKNGRKKIVEVEYFAKKAFPNKLSKLDEFGFGTVSTLGNTQADMVTFLTNLYNLTNGKYNAEFLAVNYLQPKIDEILAIKNVLADENTEQDTFADTSSQDTAARVGTLNNAFSYWQRVNAASKSIYYDNPILLNLFLFPRGTESDVDINIQGTVRNSVTNEVMSNVAVSIPSLGVTVNTDSNGQYVIGGIEPGTYDMSFSKAEFQVNNQVGVVVPIVGNIVVDALMVAL